MKQLSGYALVLTFLLVFCGFSTEEPPVTHHVEIPKVAPPLIQNDLSLLDVAFRNKVILLIHNSSELGIELISYETVRSVERQDSIFSKRPKRTNLRGGESKHQYGLAVDFVIRGGADRATWLKVGREGEKLGLRWGGRWARPFDPGHFEWGELTVDQVMGGAKPFRPDTVLIPL